MVNNIIKRRSEKNRTPLGFMRSGLDDLFDDFFHEFNIEPFRARTSVANFMPQMDITETEKEYKITAELPGMAKDEVEIDLDNDVLTIKGEKKSEHEENEKGRYHIERSYGSFSRSVKLPQNTDYEKIDAEFKDGVLHIKLPKTEESTEKMRKISIK